MDAWDKLKYIYYYCSCLNIYFFLRNWFSMRIIPLQNVNKDGGLTVMQAVFKNY